MSDNTSPISQMILSGKLDKIIEMLELKVFLESPILGIVIAGLVALLVNYFLNLQKMKKEFIVNLFNQGLIYLNHEENIMQITALHIFDMLIQESDGYEKEKYKSIISTKIKQVKSKLDKEDGLQIAREDFMKYADIIIKKHSIQID